MLFGKNGHLLMSRAGRASPPALVGATGCAGASWPWVSESVVSAPATSSTPPAESNGIERTASASCLLGDVGQAACGLAPFSRSQTLFGNALSAKLLFRAPRWSAHGSAKQSFASSAFPNRVWEREKSAKGAQDSQVARLAAGPSQAPS